MVASYILRRGQVPPLDPPLRSARNSSARACHSTRLRQGRYRSPWRADAAVGPKGPVQHRRRPWELSRVPSSRCPSEVRRRNPKPPRRVRSLSLFDWRGTLRKGTRAPAEMACWAHSRPTIGRSPWPSTASSTRDSISSDLWSRRCHSVIIRKCCCSGVVRSLAHSSLNL